MRHKPALWTRGQFSKRIFDSNQAVRVLFFFCVCELTINTPSLCDVSQVRTNDETTLGADHVTGPVVLHQQGIGVIRALHFGKSISTVVKKEERRFGPFIWLKNTHPDCKRKVTAVSRGDMTLDIHFGSLFASNLQDLYFSLTPCSHFHLITGRLCWNPNWRYHLSLFLSLLACIQFMSLFYSSASLTCWRKTYQKFFIWSPQTHKWMLEGTNTDKHRLKKKKKKEIKSNLKL